MVAGELRLARRRVDDLKGCATPSVRPCGGSARCSLRGSRWLRRRLRFAPSSILDVFRRWSNGRGFGFWWLVVTLLLAGVVGLLVAALLTPVMGILACLAVAVWFLIRKGAGNSRDQRGSAATA